MTRMKGGWWQRRRVIVTAAVVAALVLAYPLSFVPACWVLMRIDPNVQWRQWEFFRDAYEPVADVVMASPTSIQDWVAIAISVGQPDGTSISVMDDAILFTEKRGERRLEYLW